MHLSQIQQLEQAGVHTVQCSCTEVTELVKELMSEEDVHIYDI